VDPHSPLPLYHQVNAHLKDLIRSGNLRIGDMLPPEKELSRAYHVGRQTIREALTRLVNENLLERYAGRGTFVSAPPDRTKFYLDRSFTQQMADLGTESHSRVLRVSTGIIGDSMPLALHKKMGRPCLSLVRLRFGGSEPIGIQSAVVVTERCPDLDQHDFNQESLYNVLFTHYKLAIAEINNFVSAVSATDLQADLLQTSPNAPLLLVRTTAYLDNNEPIEANTSYYRADKYEFSSTHSYRECE